MVVCEQEDLPPPAALDVEVDDQDVLLPAGRIVSVLEGVIVVQVRIVSSTVPP